MESFISLLCENILLYPDKYRITIFYEQLCF